MKKYFFKGEETPLTTNDVMKITVTMKKNGKLREEQLTVPFFDEIAELLEDLGIIAAKEVPEEKPEEEVIHFNSIQDKEESVESSKTEDTESETDNQKDKETIKYLTSTMDNILNIIDINHDILNKQNKQIRSLYKRIADLEKQMTVNSCQKAESFCNKQNYSEDSPFKTWYSFLSDNKIESIF